MTPPVAAPPIRGSAQSIARALAPQVTGDLECTRPYRRGGRKNRGPLRGLRPENHECALAGRAPAPVRSANGLMTRARTREHGTAKLRIRSKSCSCLQAPGRRTGVARSTLNDPDIA